MNEDLLFKLFKHGVVVLTGLVSFMQSDKWQEVLLFVMFAAVLMFLLDKSRNFEKLHRECKDDLHNRDKLLAVVYFHLRRDANQQAVPDLDEIVGPDVAEAVKHAGDLVGPDITSIRRK